MHQRPDTESINDTWQAAKNVAKEVRQIDAGARGQIFTCPLADFESLVQITSVKEEDWSQSSGAV